MTTTPGIRRRDLRTAKLSAAGGTTTAGALFLTSACCFPIGAGAVGAALGAVANAGWELRPYLAGLAILLVGLALYRTTRRVPCDEESCATPRQQRRTRIIVWMLALLTVVMLTFPWWSGRLIYWLS